MNRTRRKRLRELHDQLTGMQEQLAVIAEEEQEYFDNMPESIQAGSKGDRASETADTLQGLADDLELAASNLLGTVEEA